MNDEAKTQRLFLTAQTILLKFHLCHNKFPHLIHVSAISYLKPSNKVAVMFGRKCVKALLWA
jgi:hypothetical protein